MNILTLGIGQSLRGDKNAHKSALPWETVRSQGCGWVAIGELLTKMLYNLSRDF
jgi:hypothetical protein